MKRAAPRTTVRLGAVVIGAGVVLDIPPHAFHHASLEALALAGHLVVLMGMAIVLTGLVLAAMAVPHTETRRPQ